MRRKRMFWRGRLTALLLLIFIAAAGREAKAAGMTTPGIGQPVPVTAVAAVSAGQAARTPSGVYAVELQTPAVGAVYELTGRRGLTLIRRSVTADANGHVRFDALPIGRYKLTGGPVTIGKITYTPGEAEFTLPAFDPVTGEELAVLEITGKCSVTQKEGPASPPSPELPRTGVTWWVVPVLFVSGVILIVIGLNRRPRSDEEEPFV